MKVLVKSQNVAEPRICGANLCPVNVICAAVVCGINIPSCGLNACGVRMQLGGLQGEIKDFPILICTPAKAGRWELG